MARNKIKPSLQGLVVPPKHLDGGTKEEILMAFRDGVEFDHYLFGVHRKVVITDYNSGDLVKITFNKMERAAFYRVTFNDIHDR